jgi:hypothetical protein
MDDKQYAKRALILALTALVLASFPITIPFLAMFITIGYDVPFEGYFKYIYGFLVAFSWIPGSIIAFIAFKMGQRMKGSILLINITRIATVLALLGTLGFGIFEMIAILIAPYAPGW